MKGFLKFVFIFSGILLLSAILAPILFDFLPYKFERIFNRLVMIFSLVAVIRFVRIRKETFREYKLLWDHGSLSFLFRAFLMGFLILGSVSVTRYFFGTAILSVKTLSVLQWSWVVLESLGAALLIGVIEEFFFRGFIFQSCYRRFGWPLGISLIVTNVFYSFLHFIDSKKPLIGDDPTFFDSFALMRAPFASFSNWQEIWPAAVGLLLFGLILNMLVLRTNSLYASIGLHAGCVFYIKMDGYFVDFVSDDLFFWGSKKIYDGVLGWFFLIILGILCFLMLKKNHLRSSEC